MQIFKRISVKSRCFGLHIFLICANFRAVFNSKIFVPISYRTLICAKKSVFRISFICSKKVLIFNSFSKTRMANANFANETDGKNGITNTNTTTTPTPPKFPKTHFKRFLATFSCFAYNLYHFYPFVRLRIVKTTSKSHVCKLSLQTYP